MYAHDEPFDGLFLNECIRRSAPERRLSWTQTDHSAGAQVVFHTDVDVTGEPSQLPIAAAYRIACLLMLARLKESGLEEACMSLSEIHLHEIENEYIDSFSLPAPDQKSIRPKAVRKVERRPLNLAD
jgi:hypothetical protein